MRYANLIRLSGILAVVGLGAGITAGAANQQSFTYDPNKAAADDGVCRHVAKLKPVEGEVYAYASFAKVRENPGRYLNGQPQGQQVVVLGRNADGKFTPAVRFGIHDDKKVVKDRTFLTPWLFDGTLDYYGGYVRPNTPYDFKIRLNIKAGTVTVWFSGRGDDDWSLPAENVPLMSPVTAINEVRIEQWPGAPGVCDLRVQSEPWKEGLHVRPHPSAKKGRVVGPGRGFQFQSMRSTWRKPGRHVTIARKPPVWFGFPDVVQVDAETLICTHNDGRRHGGGGGMFVRRSSDLGRTWSDAIKVHPGGVNCPRIQKLRDGTLVLHADVAGASRIVFYDSTDGGKTWTNQRFLVPKQAGEAGKHVYVPSRILQLADGSWLIGTSWSPGGTAYHLTEGERLEVYHSTDRGRTWKRLSEISGGPPHSLSEPSLVALPDGRLLLFAREGRNDGYPAIKAYSRDGGKTWKVQDLPFAIIGRTCAGLLRDGRVMVTFRSGIGLQELWAWIGDPDDSTGFRPQGVHFNDAQSVGLKDGALHIDNDGIRGQFTQYFLRAPDSVRGAVEVTAEVKVVANAGRATTICVPFAGKLRIFPDHVQMAHDASLRVNVTPGEFHTYRMKSGHGKMELYVDGKSAFKTDKVDARTKPSAGWTPETSSLYGPAFGNEQRDEPQWASVGVDEITPEVTGYSIWRRVEQKLSDPKTGIHAVSWGAPRDGFPDQYQLDHMIRIEASAFGWDEGYSGWVELDDGRIFVVNYTDDTAPPQPKQGRGGIAWIRGTYLLGSDLPTHSSRKGHERG